MKNNRKLIYIAFLLASFLVPFSIAIYNLYFGTIPFWYDPARDLIMALGNHEKISLIGQTSGIPGIFYGPYWIWFLSLALFISHDPRIVAFIVVTLPYFILFPFILFKFRKQFGNLTPVLLWLLFITSFSAYTTQLWNPHLGPLMCLLAIYLLVSQDYKKSKWKEFLKVLAAGLSGGLLMNLHISFGLAVIVGSVGFLLFSKSKFKTLPLFFVGILITYMPFFVFELRHGFNQIQTLLETVTSSSSVVKETSVDKLQIVNLFFNSLARLLQVPTMVMYFLIGVAIIMSGILYKKGKLILTQEEKKLLLIIFSIFVSTFGIYLSTKNPVWDYHFIGVEILFLLLIGIYAKRSIFVRYSLLCWVTILLTLSVTNFIGGLQNNPLKVPSLATKEHIVDTIYNDAQSKSFSVFIYSPATFTPDFDYLFAWEGEKRKNSANLENRKADLIYLIIPLTSEDLRADFIDNRTPNEEYKTVRTWKIMDETEILKRVRYAKK